MMYRAFVRVSAICAPALVLAVGSSGPVDAADLSALLSKVSGPQTPQSAKPAAAAIPSALQISPVGSQGTVPHSSLPQSQPLTTTAGARQPRQTFEEWQLGVARTLRYQGRYAEARKVCQNILKTDPQNADAHKELRLLAKLDFSQHPKAKGLILASQDPRIRREAEARRIQQQRLQQQLAARQQAEDGSKAESGGSSFFSAVRQAMAGNSKTREAPNKLPAPAQPRPVPQVATATDTTTPVAAQQFSQPIIKQSAAQQIVKPRAIVTPKRIQKPAVRQTVKSPTIAKLPHTPRMVAHATPEPQPQLVKTAPVPKKVEESPAEWLQPIPKQRDSQSLMEGKMGTWVAVSPDTRPATKPTAVSEPKLVQRPKTAQKLTESSVAVTEPLQEAAINSPAVVEKPAIKLPAVIEKPALNSPAVVEEALVNSSALVETSSEEVIPTLAFDTEDSQPAEEAESEIEVVNLEMEQSPVPELTLAEEEFEQPAEQPVISPLPPVERKQASSPQRNAHPNPEVVGHLRKLESRSAEDRAAAAYSLGEMNLGDMHKIAMKKLRHALRIESDWNARIFLSESILKLDASDQTAVRELRRALRSPNADERFLAAFVLCVAPADQHPQVIEELARALSDREPRVRNSAALALGVFGPAAEKALPDLRRAAKDRDPEVREAVLVAIATIKPDTASDETSF